MKWIKRKNVYFPEEYNPDTTLDFEVIVEKKKDFFEITITCVEFEHTISGKANSLKEAKEKAIIYLDEMKNEKMKNILKRTSEQIKCIEERTLKKIENNEEGIGFYRYYENQKVFDFGKLLEINEVKVFQKEENEKIYIYEAKTGICMFEGSLSAYNRFLKAIEANIEIMKREILYLWNIYPEINNF